jgi:hypothetical protein
MRALVLASLMGAALATAPPLFAQDSTLVAKRMLSDAKVEAHFKIIDVPNAILLLHRQSGLLCSFEANATREISGSAEAARCRNADEMGDFVLTVRRGRQSLQAEHADLRQTMRRDGALAPPLCDLDATVPYCQVSATRNEGGATIDTAAFVGVRDGWVFTARAVGKPGQRVEMMARSTFKGMVETPEP